MEKKQMLTVMLFIPALNSNITKNADDTIKEIMYRLGTLNCENVNNYAIIKYDGILNKNAKKILTDIANQRGYLIIYLEAEDDTPFVDDDTFHIPTNKEIKEHLKG